MEAKAASRVRTTHFQELANQIHASSTNSCSSGSSTTPLSEHLVKLPQTCASTATSYVHSRTQEDKFVFQTWTLELAMDKSQGPRTFDCRTVTCSFCQNHMILLCNKDVHKPLLHNGHYTEFM